MLSCEPQFLQGGGEKAFLAVCLPPSGIGLERDGRRGPKWRVLDTHRASRDEAGLGSWDISARQVEIGGGHFLPKCESPEAKEISQNRRCFPKASVR